MPRSPFPTTVAQRTLQDARSVRDRLICSLNDQIRRLQATNAPARMQGQLEAEVAALAAARSALLDQRDAQRLAEQEQQERELLG